MKLQEIDAEYLGIGQVDAVVADEAVKVARAAIRHYFREHSKMSRKEISREMISKLLGKIGCGTHHSNSLQIESVISALIRKGVKKENVSFKEDCFYVRLPHSIVHFYRNAGGNTGYIDPRTVYILGVACHMTYDAEDEAKTILEFDRLSDDILASISNIEVFLTREIKAYEIASRTASIVAHDMLKGTGIESYCCDVGWNGKVKIGLRLLDGVELINRVPLNTLGKNIKSMLEKVKTRLSGDTNLI